MTMHPVPSRRPTASAPCARWRTAFRPWVLWLALAGFLLWADTAHAHRPEILGGPPPREPIQVEDPSVSQVFYATLAQERDVLRLEFESPAVGYSLFLQLGVPKMDRLVDYRPTVVLVGPGLPEPPDGFPVPAQQGALVFDSDADPQPPQQFHEPVTGTDSWILLERTIELPAPGRYEVIAFSSDQRNDKLWVALGTVEEFGLDDIFRLARWIVAVRQFHEVSPGPLWFLATIGGILAGLAFVAVCLGRLLMRRLPRQVR